MITKNQYEKSVIFIKENVPIFVRNSYIEFAKLFSHVADYIAAEYKYTPYTTAMAAKALRIGSTDIIALARCLADSQNNRDGIDIVNVILSDICNNTRIKRASDQKMTADEVFYSKNSQDIYAPLDTIKLAVTPFTGFDDIGSSFVHKGFECVKVPLSITIERSSYVPTEDLAKISSSGRGEIGSYNIEDSMGVATVLDQLNSVCNVDINQLFACFLQNLSDRFSEYDYDDKESGIDSAIFKNFLSKHMPAENLDFNNKDAKADREVMKLLKLASIAMDTDKSEEINGIIDSISEILTASMTLTYLTFASKLIGSKSDVFGWAYKSFIKDEMNHFDIANYPTASDVSGFTGTGIDGEGHFSSRSAGVNGALIESLSESHLAQDNEYTRQQKSAVYRSIKLKFSSWAAIINAIMSSNISDMEEHSFNVSDIDRQYGFTSRPYQVSNPKDKNGPTRNALYLIVCEALIQFLRCKYRTFNTTIQIKKNSDLPCSSYDMIKPVVNLIHDSDAKMALKECIGLNGASKELTVNSVLLTHDAKIETILKFNESATTKIGNIFLRIAYLILMQYTHTHMGDTISQKDPITGKTWGQIYEEIYYGISESIKKELEDYGRYPTVYALNHADFDKLNFNNTFILLTPYLKETKDNNRCDIDGFASVSTRCNLAYDRFSGKIVNYKFSRLSDNEVPKLFVEVRNHIEDKDRNYVIRNLGNRRMSEYVVEDNSDFPYLSECYALRLCNDFNIGIHRTDTDIVLQNPINADGSLFPKHRLITEAITKLTPRANRAFVTLESVDSAISTIESLTNVGLEGADGMASNSCYSSLGALCGPVSEFEITNEGCDKDKTHLEIESPGFIPSMGQDTDSEGKLTSGPSKGAIDQKHFTSSESNKAIEDAVLVNKRKELIDRYNILFNRLIAE